MPIIPLPNPSVDESSAVDELHPEYKKMLESWKKMYDTCISETHMHKQKETYLPKLDEMSDPQYEAYTKRAEFPMYTKHSLDAFVGLSMRKDLLINGITVDHPFFKNCDGNGSTLKAYSENLVRLFLQYGRCGSLVEIPIADPEMSMADAEAQNITTRLAFYDHASIINWKTSTENNLRVLTLVVLREEVAANDDEFSHEYENQYRVLKLVDGEYIQEIYNDSMEFVRRITPLMDNKPLNFIPFIIHGGEKVTPPAMLPIAEQNIHWYMKDADYQHGLHYTALPTPYVIGVDSSDPNLPKTIGPQKLWALPLGASAGMLEFTGAGLAQVSKSIDDTMTNIKLLSSQILTPKSAYDESATAASIRSASETASLSSMVNGLSADLTLLVIVASNWGGFFVKDTSIKINSDFIPLTLSGADVSSYVSSVLKEGFSKRTLFELLKKGEIIEGSRQYEDEMTAIAEEAAARRDDEVELAARLAAVEAVLAKLNKPDDTDEKDKKRSSQANDPKKAAKSSDQQASQ